MVALVREMGLGPDPKERSFFHRDEEGREIAPGKNHQEIAKDDFERIGLGVFPAGGDKVRPGKSEPFRLCVVEGDVIGLGGGFEEQPGFAGKNAVHALALPCPPRFGATVTHYRIRGRRHDPAGMISNEFKKREGTARFPMMPRPPRSCSRALASTFPAPSAVAGRAFTVQRTG